MSTPSTSPAAWEAFGPDPGRGIRVFVALLLRFGIGLSLLNTGLAGYLNVRTPGGMGGAIPNVSFAGLDPLISAMPYLAMGLGLALILGFLTTPTAVAAGFFGLMNPLMTTVAILSAASAGGGFGGPGMGRFGGNPFESMMMMLGMSGYVAALIPQAALIWLSPLENHPYSVDAMIFGRNAIEPLPPMDGSAREADSPVVSEGGEAG